MTYALRFLPIVEEDALAGYTWYEEKARGLGGEFLRVFYACAREIPRNPLLYPKVYREFRRRLLRRFPYAIYFQSAIARSRCAREPLIKAYRRLSTALYDVREGTMQALNVTVGVTYVAFGGVLFEKAGG